MDSRSAKFRKHFPLEGDFVESGDLRLRQLFLPVFLTLSRYPTSQFSVWRVDLRDARMTMLSMEDSQAFKHLAPSIAGQTFTSHFLPTPSKAKGIECSDPLRRQLSLQPSRSLDSNPTGERRVFAPAGWDSTMSMLGMVLS